VSRNIQRVGGEWVWQTPKTKGSIRSSRDTPAPRSWLRASRAAAWTGGEIALRALYKIA
jgi:hypothetical protein